MIVVFHFCRYRSNRAKKTKSEPLIIFRLGGSTTSFGYFFASLVHDISSQRGLQSLRDSTTSSCSKIKQALVSGTTSRKRDERVFIVVEEAHATALGVLCHLSTAHSSAVKTWRTSSSSFFSEARLGKASTDGDSSDAITCRR